MFGPPFVISGKSCLTWNVRLVPVQFQPFRFFLWALVSPNFTLLSHHFECLRIATTYTYFVINSHCGKGKGKILNQMTPKSSFTVQLFVPCAGVCSKTKPNQIKHCVPLTVKFRWILGAKIFKFLMSYSKIANCRVTCLMKYEPIILTYSAIGYQILRTRLSLGSI